MSWFFTIFLLLCSSINSLEANLHHRKNLPSAVVVGTVYCDTCFQDDFSKSSHFIPGATVAVECKDDKSKPSFRQEAKTDEHGEFQVHLPFSVSKHVRRIKRCSVRLIKSSQPNCAVASSATSSSLNLKSRKPGTHVFSAGFFTFKPLNQPNQCSQKPKQIRDSKKVTFEKTSFPPMDNNNPNFFPPPIQDPNPSTPIIPDLPPLDQNPLPPVPLLPNLPPLPQLQPLPPLPTLPNLPPMPGKRTDSKKPEEAKASREKETSEDKAANPQIFFPPVLPPNPLMPPLLPPNPLIPPPLLPPNPLMPPPLLPPNPLIPPPVLPPNPLMPPPLLPPNPLIPPPLLPPNPLMPPPLLPPNPLQPPPAPLIPLPPVPGINPSPPPAPTLPVPLPPLLPPPSTPPFPGIPPADTTTTSQKKRSP